MRRFKPTGGCIAPVVGAILSFCAPGIVRAAHISFIEGSTGPEGEGPLQVLPDGNWDVSEPQVTVTDNENAMALGGSFFSTSPPGLSGTLFAFMLDDLETRQISDVIRVQYNTVPTTAGFPSIAFVDVFFSSDVEGQPPRFLPANIPGLLEDGTNQLLNDYFVAAGTFESAPLPNNITISALSDVPEPASLALLGLGSLALLRRRRVA